jgi:gamma-glutamylcysteine synthetase
VLDKILKDESEENLTLITIPDEDTNTIYTTMQDRHRESKIKLITQVST